MKQEKWFCDVCKKEVEKQKDLKTVSLGFGNLYSSTYTYAKIYDLCSDCRFKLGLIQSKPPSEDTHQQESIENRLFNIVAEIVQMMGVNNG